MRWPGPSGWRRRPSGSTSPRSAGLTSKRLISSASRRCGWPARRSRRAARRRSSSMPPTRSRSPPSSAGEIGFTRYRRDSSRRRLIATSAAAPRSIADVIDIDRETRGMARRPDERDVPPDARPAAALVHRHRVPLRDRPARLHPRARPLFGRRAGSGSAPRPSRSASAARSPAGPTSAARAGRSAGCRSAAMSASSAT